LAFELKVFLRFRGINAANSDNNFVILFESSSVEKVNLFALAERLDFGKVVLGDVSGEISRYSAILRIVQHSVWLLLVKNFFLNLWV
jgi:hypothetical protein